MCVIAIIDKKMISKKLNIEKTIDKMACANPDGVGIVTKKSDGSWFTHKHADSFHAYNYIDMIKQSKLTVLHFRLATHGIVSKSMSHPFTLDTNTLFMHNGIISGLGDDKVSDTYQLANMLADMPQENRIKWLNVLNVQGSGKFCLVDMATNTVHRIGKFEKDKGMIVSNTHYNITFTPKGSYAFNDTPNAEDWENYFTNTSNFKKN